VPKFGVTIQAPHGVVQWFAMVPPSGIANGSGRSSLNFSSRIWLGKGRVKEHTAYIWTHGKVDGTARSSANQALFKHRALLTFPPAGPGKRHKQAMLSPKCSVQFEQTVS